MIGRHKYEALIEKQKAGIDLTEFELADIYKYEQSTWDKNNDFKELQKKALDEIKKLREIREQKKQNPGLSELQLKKRFVDYANQIVNEHKKQNGEIVKYIIDDININAITYFWKYFSLQNKGDQHKGICLVGSNGSGKSILMEIHRRMKWFDNKFKSVTSFELVRLFSKKGYEGIERYFTGDLFIDEVGAEPTGMYFGNRINVLEIVLLERYNAYQKNGSRTHITTNLNKEMLGDFYGKRLASRMHEMFNFVILGKNDRDFRKDDKN